MKRLLALLVLISFNAFAADKVTIEADSVDTPEESVFHAKGNVKIFQGDKTLLADEVFYNKKNNTIRALDNVTLSSKGSKINCDELEYNTEKSTGTFKNADAFMPPYHWFSASEMKRHNEYSYGFDDVTFSTCSGKVPDWSFKASEADIVIGGYLTAKHTTARVKDVPILYSPYFIYPVKTERETGFLIPDFGYNSDTDAFIQPHFFWNMGADQDATISTVLSAKKNPLYAVEHRLKPSRNDSVYTYLEFTSDDKRYPSTESNTYKLEEENGRFFVYNTSMLKLADGLYFRSQVDTVSDYEYLDDFEKFSQLEDYDNSTDTYKTNFTLNYNAKFADFYLKYIDTMEYNLGSSYTKEHTYSAPRISVQKNISKFPVYFKYYAGFDKVRYTKYNHAYANEKTTTSETRFDREHLTLKAYKPFNLYVGTFTPSIKGYYTKWHNFEGDFTMPSEDDISSFAKVTTGNDSITRKIYTQLHTLKLNEIYKDYDGFRHSIYNTFAYEQTPKLNQSGISDIIYDDDIDPSREYRYSLNNYLGAASWSVSLVNEYTHVLMDDSDENDELTTKLNITTQPLALGVKHELDVEDGEDDYFRSYAVLSIKPFRISGSYTYDRDDYDSDGNNTSAELAAAYVSKKYDLTYTRSVSGVNEGISTSNLSDVSDEVKVTYKSECWSFDVRYIREDDNSSVDKNRKDEVEHTIMFNISLRGLGDSPGAFSDSFDEDNTDED